AARGHRCVVGRSGSNGWLVLSLAQAADAAVQGLGGLYFPLSKFQKGTNLMSSSAVEYARQNQPRFLDELKALLRIPSVSTLPEHAGDCHFAAEVLAAELARIGMEDVRLIETAGHPLVYADWLHAAGKPTVLAYGHYDVQPPDPLDEWLTPPFEPMERDGNLYARGAVDDKGQMYMHVKALESLLATNGGLPLNVRVLLEGEEEVGGEG